MTREDYIKKIEENKDLQVKTLQDIIAAKSVVAPPARNESGELYPFGKGVQEAFETALKIAEEFGFETKNVDNYGGHIEFGKGEEIVGVLGHLDVVHEGDGWTFDPYSGAATGDYIYGRGTTDDKGPVIAVLFAMKALKDAGYEPSKKIRLILGLDEETDWNGMTYYFEREKAPDYGFTPDADFPALNGEKGILTFEIAKKLPRINTGGLALRSLTGGNASNQVPENARAVIRIEKEGNGKKSKKAKSSEPINVDQYEEIKAIVNSFKEETGYDVTCKAAGSSLGISASGKSAHAATPEAGLNAISILMAVLGRLNFANDDINDFIEFYNEYIGFDLNGKNIGCGFFDEASGKLTLNVGIVSYDRESITLTVNVRYPVSTIADNVYDGIMPIVNKYNLGVVKVKDRAPIYMEPDSPLIQTLVEIYQNNTGDLESKPQVIGGGTYARATDNIVAFGGLFPGDEDLMHQRDERISIDRFMTMTKIYADALYKLTQEDFNILEE